MNIEEAIEVLEKVSLESQITTEMDEAIPVVIEAVDRYQRENKRLRKDVEHLKIELEHERLRQPQLPQIRYSSNTLPESEYNRMLQEQYLYQQRYCPPQNTWTGGIDTDPL